MNQESIDYLDNVACLANANLAYHQQTSSHVRSETEGGMALLMSAFLEMHDHWKSASPGTEPPSDRIYMAADACVLMRSNLLNIARHRWTAEAEGLYQMITAYMLLFKHMYVRQ